ncbi:hypothetical protein Bcav_0999 [Beutenbergia cavernae DSM 12333]|uniref:Uncharacterized protein n=1 Tax=Beutenbergia cavernae (strain ATCC BAA-8 / DSM 12333 / CCUG 43141 / JCM 11478 / NBRC 16432 / NCIMB 13614 / HKI 0122) TaxID=471853 RepID=C5C074_BEUC1|nr:DUF6492 family protein [Beutenbergia cavernae]ACQ79260.1 hypothetical protein Bcav_0999 [Beutenbergia cavernae DSM 12333]
MAAITYVTPVFEAEVELLALQARSLARHASSASLAEVLVLDNTARGLTSPTRDRLHEAYGPHAPAVRILRPREIAHIPGATGWRSQQVLKLAAAHLVRTPHYVTLDAKNHLVAPPDASFYVAPDGRARVPAYSFADHPLRPSLEHVLRYLELDPGRYVDHFTATTTPYVLETGLVRELMADLAERSGRTFAAEFLANDLTEYFLYAGWLIRRDGTVAAHVDASAAACPVVWPRTASSSGVADTVRRAREGDLPYFSVHRNAVPVLDGGAVAVLADYWAERGLVDDRADGEAVLARMRASHAAQARRQQVRDLPHRARTLLRRTRDRLAGRRTL